MLAPPSERRQKWEVQSITDSEREGLAEERGGIETTERAKEKETISQIRVKCQATLKFIHTEESVSHFRDNTGSRACSVQGEQERVGEGRGEGAAREGRAL